MCDPPGYCTTSPSIQRAAANVVGERLKIATVMLARHNLVH